MKKIIFSLLMVLGSASCFTSCSDDIDLVIPYPTNITFQPVSLMSFPITVFPCKG